MIVDYQNYLTIADLNLVSIGDAWKSKAFRELREKHLSKKLNNTLCDNCWNYKCEKIQPLNSELSTKIDEVEYGKDIEKRISKKVQFSKF